jgi:hypothetical protein
VATVSQQHLVSSPSSHNVSCMYEGVKLPSDAYSLDCRLCMDWKAPRLIRHLHSNASNGRIQYVEKMANEQSHIITNSIVALFSLNKIAFVLVSFVCKRCIYKSILKRER